MTSLDDDVNKHSGAYCAHRADGFEDETEPFRCGPGTCRPQADRRNRPTERAVPTQGMQRGAECQPRPRAGTRLPAAQLSRQALYTQGLSSPTSRNLNYSALLPSKPSAEQEHVSPMREGAAGRPGSTALGRAADSQARGGSPSSSRRLRARALAPRTVPASPRHLEHLSWCPT